MSTQILMPALSPTMTEGKLAKWLKNVGDDVHAGDVIAEIETDKATMEVEAVDEGKLSEILVDEGTEGIAVNTPIAVLVGNGEDTSAAPASPPRREEAPAAQREPSPKREAAPMPKVAAEAEDMRSIAEQAAAGPAQGSGGNRQPRAGKGLGSDEAHHRARGAA